MEVIKRGPRLDGPAEAAPVRDAVGRAVARPTILVVEDNVDTREILPDILEDAGYDVMLASDGLEGVSLFNRHAQIAAVILDLMMPGLDGWEFLATMRGRMVHRRVPVIVFSAFLETAAVDADAVLRKPS